jgi:hypothetical protein
MTALPQSRLELDLRAQVESLGATLERQAVVVADLRERMRLVRGLTTDAEVLDDCGPTARRAMARIAAWAAGKETP